MPRIYKSGKSFQGNENSGRKTARDEQLRIDVIEKAWLKKQKRMNDNEATQIVLKDMTEKSTTTVILPKPIDDIFKNNGLQENKANDEASADLSGGDERV